MLFLQLCCNEVYRILTTDPFDACSVHTSSTALNTRTHISACGQWFNGSSSALCYLLPSPSAVFTHPPFSPCPSLLLSHLYWWSEPGRYPSGPLTYPGNASVPANNNGLRTAKFAQECRACVYGCAWVSARPFVPVLIMHITSASTFMRKCRLAFTYWCFIAACHCH